MESSLQSPYAFFEYYFKVTLYEHYESFEEEQVRNKYKYKNPYTTFIDYIGVPHTQELIKSKNFVEQNISSRLTNKNEFGSYLNFLKAKLSTLAKTKAFNEFKFVRTYVQELEEHLESSSIQSIVVNINSLTFSLLGNSNEEVDDKINKLYQQLTEHPPMIRCTDEDFKKAFSGQEIGAGIQWLVTGKNRKISKTSLFYLIEQLIDSGHLSRYILNDLNKYVKSVFRDDEGKELNNLKQSKSTYSSKVSHQDRIDDIVFSI